MSGRAVILLPYWTWAGVSSSSWITSDETRASGLSFNMASILTIMVCSVVNSTDARPSTFFRVVVVRLINRSQRLPCHGAHFSMNCQFTHCLLSNSFNDCDINNSVNSSAADRYAEPLSGIICWGTDFRATNRRYARRKICSCCGAGEKTNVNLPSHLN